MINYDEVDISVEMDGEYIEFWHEPENEDEIGSQGIVTFECHKSIDGDGLITPIENLLECYNFELTFDGNIEQPEKYERELLKVIIDKSDLT
jgi:hypothetical protein